MELINMFYDDIKDAADRNVPFIIPIGTIEYHAHHLSCGTDTMVITGQIFLIKFIFINNIQSAKN